ncbi:MAG: class I SAM-dependent methyltransferase [Blastocatellia bacterium]
MKITDITSAMAGVNLCALKMALKNPRRARGYLSHCLRKYDEMTGQGLPAKDPVKTIVQNGWGAFDAAARVELPTQLTDGGGTSLNELLLLANVTRVLQPQKVFEIGTFNGRTTSAFILNAPATADIVTLDLPPDESAPTMQASDVLMTDKELIARRQVGHFIHALQLTQRCQQVFCNSLEFDPTPHEGTVELGFIDGAHTQPLVQNDTIKMAMMAAERGLVFWHDYGGKGHFRGLAVYLEMLAKESPLYRVSGTTLAWCQAADLRKILV